MLENSAFYFGKTPGTASLLIITFHSVDKINSPAQHSYYLGDKHLLSLTCVSAEFYFCKISESIFRKQI